MNKENIISKLQSQETIKYLQEHQIKHIRLGGSYVREDHNANSDIDIIYEYDTSVPLFERGPVDALLFLEKLLEKKIDFLDKEYIHSLIKTQIYNQMQQIW